MSERRRSPRPTPLRGDHARAGRELLLRDQAAPAASGAARCAPSTRSRAASTTSATATSAASEKLRAARRRGAALAAARAPGAARARRRPGDGRAGGRHAPLPAARRRARRADRGRAHGRRRRRLRDLRGARRSTAAASPGRSGALCLAIFGLREPRRRASPAPTARRRARRRAAADEHPARRARGRRERARLPPGRGSAPLRPRPDEDPSERSRAAVVARRRRRGRGPAARRSSALVALRGRARAASGSPAGWSSRRCSTAAAPPACSRWRASTAGCSSASTPTRRRCWRGRMSLPAREKAWVARPRPARGRRVSARCVRRRRRPGRDRRGARLRCGGRGRDARGGAPAAGRRRLLRSSATGLQMDNGQHVFLRCCTAYRALLDAARQRAPRRGPAAAARSRCSRPGASPSCCAAARCRRRCISPARSPATRTVAALERLGAARAALALMRLDPGDPALDGSTLGSGSRVTARDHAAVAALWDLIALPTLNLPAADASLALGAFVFRTRAARLRRRPGTSASTWARSARSSGDPPSGPWPRPAWTCASAGAPSASSAAGADSAARSQRRLAGTASSAEAVIVALPHDRAAGLLEPLLGARAAGLRRRSAARRS